MEPKVAYCPDCERETTFTEIEPLDENLDDKGEQIKEFECSICQLTFTESELEEWKVRYD